MPGQAVSDLAQLGCQTPQHRPGQDSNRVLCHLFPEDGPFHLITLVLYHRVIGEVSFYSETLQLGELIADWQEYDSSRRSPSGQIVTLSWDRADYRISAVVSLLSRQPHVQLVTLTATDGIVPT